MARRRATVKLSTDPRIGKCKDCREEELPLTRSAPYAGPRCYSHHQARKRNVRLAQHGRRIESVYGMTAEEYQAQYEFQGGKCAICQRATGTGRKRLAVDHDHRCTAGHPHQQGCPLCVRGLVCGPCNDVLAHFRDDIEAAKRLAAYLEFWPTKRLRLRKAAQSRQGDVIV